MDNIKDIFKNKPQTKKPPAYEWQDLALRVINELNVPNFKRSSVFKACKEAFKTGSQTRIIQALTDTQELCQTGQKWQYFFKILSPNKDNKNNTKKC